MEAEEAEFSQKPPVAISSAPPERSVARWIPFAALQAFGLAICCAFIGLDASSVFQEEWMVPTVFGIYYGHILLAAAITVFGPWSILIRLTMPPLLLAAEACFALVFAEHGPSGGESFMIGVLTIFTWGIVQLPFWLSRYLLAVRLRLLDSDQEEGPQGEQFSVKQLLIFTLIVAVVFGLGKAIVSQRQVEEFLSFSLEGAMTFALLVGAVIASGLIIVHSGLQARRRVAAFAASGASVLAIVFGLRYALGQIITSGPTNATTIFSNAVAAQAVWLAMSVATLRIRGWRLLRG